MPNTHLEAGLAAARKKDYKGALSHFLQGYAEDPENPDILADIGFAYMMLGLKTEAQTFLKESLRVNPDQPKARQYLAKLQGFADPPTSQVEKLPMPEIKVETAPRQPEATPATSTFRYFRQSQITSCCG